MSGRSREVCCSPYARAADLLCTFVGRQVDRQVCNQTCVLESKQGCKQEKEGSKGEIKQEDKHRQPTITSYIVIVLTGHSCT